TETFRRLAERNIETLRESGAKTVLATCPECFLSLSRLYPSVGKLPFEVRHFYDFLLEHRGRLAFGPGGAAVTFHDPCRLAKHLGIHDTPRDLLAMAGADLREMPRSRERSVCCGTSGWSNCGLAAKTLQRGRLEEAVASGARTLVTACPKCRIHLSCANHDEKRDLRIVDLVEFLANGRKT
ncbi:MAG: (Fe-S)-binding protein, partial [Planctomycetes bacterium]|nr:(Fe-S)-binding protein [Planctomycetota bacterium]